MKIPKKFQNVSAFTFSTYGNELMMVFSGFEEEEDAKEFADFVFAKIQMKYWNSDSFPTIH